jgi:hypothetical protein
MSPPAEQLIRAYLSRLSNAARGQLGPDDRRALVDRTREFIERKTGPGGPPTALEVGRLLSGLGDPAWIVSQERQRLAALRGEESLEPVSRGRLARVLFGEPGKVRGASWHWPVQPGNRNLPLRLIDGGAPSGPGAAASAAAGVEPAGSVAAEAAGQLVPSTTPPGDPASARPRWPALVARTAAGTLAPRGQELQDAWQQEADQRSFDQQAPEPNPQDAAEDARPAGLAAMTWLATPARPGPSRPRELLVKVGGWARRHKLEAVAVALLGLGGAIFPPVWLLGALVALASRLWDYRDKWVGLALPVLLTLIGAAAGFAVGGRVSFGHGMHEGWAFAVDISRAMAVLCAFYLGWRASAGRRPPTVPPWDKPHRVA